MALAVQAGGEARGGEGSGAPDGEAAARCSPVPTIRTCGFMLGHAHAGEFVFSTVVRLDYPAVDSVDERADQHAAAAVRFNKPLTIGETAKMTAR